MQNGGFSINILFRPKAWNFKTHVSILILLLTAIILLLVWRLLVLRLVDKKAAQPVEISSVELAGKQIPLPNRLWITANSGREVQDLATGPTVIESKVFLGLEYNKIVAFVVIHSNPVPYSGGWGISSDCKNPEYPYTAVFEQQNRHFACAFVKEVKSDSGVLAWPAELTLASKHRWNLPNRWLIVGIRLADRLDVVDVRYGFDPQLLTKNTLPTANNQNSNDVLHQSTIQALIKWKDVALYLVERGFRRQLSPDLIMPMPTSTAEQPAAELVVANRLQQLVALRNEGWLSEAEFKVQQQLIPKSFLTESDLTVDIWRLGAIKTAGHTAQTTLWMWGMNYLFLGNAYLAGGLALTKAVISPIRYYLEETTWNTWGPRRNPTLPIVDFGHDTGR